tara:strand:- start:1703 stop:2269 length:567 start_codon:yes stop_codon:yes gene_type:complete
MVVTFFVERFFLLKNRLNMFMGINGLFIVIKMFKITRARNAGWYEVENQRGPRIYPSKLGRYILWIPPAELFLDCEEDGTVEWIDSNGKPPLRFEVKDGKAHIKLKQAHNNFCVYQAIVNGEPRAIRFGKYPEDICIMVRWSGRARGKDKELKRRLSGEKWFISPTKNADGKYVCSCCGSIKDEINCC